MPFRRRLKWLAVGCTVFMLGANRAAAVTVPAVELLDKIPVEREHREGYDRSLFPQWLDIDDGVQHTGRSAPPRLAHPRSGERPVRRD